ncbi:MAG: DUF1573 domain-containing protein [Planctomycetes bacterium]|nr:DUF1573 domain-containing protein [Planctomycetota bacterium]MBL7146453.1 DUF1573 domain-containing protein [Phycisphaerae bacterium]
MKLNRLTLSVLTILVTGCILFLQAGCEEEAMEPRTLNPDWFKQQTWAAINQQASQQTSQQAPQRMVTVAPGIAFEKVTHNFGDVGPGTNHLCEFRFTNTGNSVLKIGDVTKVCGCTPFSLDKTEYAQGESGTLRVRYYAEPPYGSTKKQLFVYSNDRRNPKIALNIEARIAAKVDFEPKALSLSLKHQNAGCPQITLSSLDNQPFSIRSFKSTANFITAAYNPSEMATSFVLQPMVDMAKLEQTLNGRIEIELTHPECKTVAIGVNALPRFNVAPHPIVVHGVQAKNAVKKKVRIQNNYKDAFELESVRSKKGIVQVVSSQKLNDGYELELSITPPAQRSRASLFTDTIVVKIKGGGNLEIPFEGFYPRQTAIPRVPLNQKTTTKSAKECKTCMPKIF